MRAVTRWMPLCNKRSQNSLTVHNVAAMFGSTRAVRRKYISHPQKPSKFLSSASVATSSTHFRKLLICVADVNFNLSPLDSPDFGP